MNLPHRKFAGAPGLASETWELKADGGLGRKQLPGISRSPLTSIQIFERSRLPRLAGILAPPE
jgi:hypothetical protein